MASRSELAGKTAFVTGASSGLGRRMAEVLAGAGVKVAVAARRRERLEELTSEIAAAGGHALPVVMDVRDAASIPGAIDEAESALGPIDILVNNAGISVVKRAEDFTPEDYAYVMETNLNGPWFCAQTVGQRMIKRGQGGKIINIASMLGMRAISKLALYSMSKAAVIQMTESLALEWGRHDIQINAICPGYIETEMNRDYWRTEGGQKLMSLFPRQRIGQPEALDGALLMLAGPQSDFINGAILPVDDGQRFM